MKLVLYFNSPTRQRIRHSTAAEMLRLRRSERRPPGAARVGWRLEGEKRGHVQGLELYRSLMQESRRNLRKIGIGADSPVSQR